ncbi:hypothetical protein [Jeotgalibacillus marinus]|uniref:Uncharacterized protein n=1 Tax=Jeotgalibacillus marinus TaxID=86667 RepID=A0ABV3Q657_9BACL
MMEKQVAQLQQTVSIMNSALSQQAAGALSMLESVSQASLLLLPAPDPHKGYND